MTGLNPDLFGLADINTDPCEGRDFYETTFGARASVIQPIGQQRNGEWALLVVWLENPRQSSSGHAPTMFKGELCITRDAWLRPLDQREAG
jgi:hypothetical protein